MFSSIQVRNVQEAYVRGLQLVRAEGLPEETRNGPALVIPHPVVTVYERPYERVLLDPVRDANPFFHLMESMWMLAGRRDVSSLEPFNAGLKQYSDDGEIYHGAYGNRWRAHFVAGHGGLRLDQLVHVIELLRANPDDRRVVLQMWDPTWDLGRNGRDFPCNLTVLFRVRRRGSGWNTGTSDLDMTVFNRSNDCVWGAYGANAVHFSILQEFVAASCGMSPGHMYQWSNNLHGYVETMEKVGEPALYTRRDVGRGQSDAMVGLTMYDSPEFRADPLFNPNRARRETTESVLGQIDAFWDGAEPDPDNWTIFTPRGLETLVCVRSAYLAFKRKDRVAALGTAETIPHLDWRRACVEWLERRYSRDS